MGALDSVVAALQTALADAQAVAAQPASAPAPAPAPAATSYPQYAVSDTGYGPIPTDFCSELNLQWPAYLANHNWKLGNWIDATGASQGSVPYATVEIPIGAAVGYVETDITALVAKWVTTGKNTGAYLSTDSKTFGSAYALIGGRLSANPPQLVVDGVTISGVIGGWFPSSTVAQNTTQQAKLSSNFIGLLHFPGVSSLTAAPKSAVLRLHVEGTNATLRVGLRVFETDPPYAPCGADGETPILGLAAEVGESNLPGNPAVYGAGDFSQANWFYGVDSTGQPYATRKNPAKVGNETSAASPNIVPGFTLTFGPDEDDASRQYMRPSMVHGNGDNAATSSISLRSLYGCTPAMSDPLRAIDPATVIDELYVRAVMVMETDFVTAVDGIKGGIGFEARSGWWNDNAGGYWQPTTGNSGVKGTGLKVVSTATSAQGRYEYQGHSIRQHMLYCRPSESPYQNYLPVVVMVSHLGPYANAPYGTEEIIRCGDAVFEKGVKVCFELRIKMNSIDLSAPDALGNGVANHDGIMQMWVDGVLRWTKNDFAWRRHPEMGVDGPWILFMHGGVVPAAVGEVLHYRLYDFACAKQYIGPRT